MFAARLLIVIGHWFVDMGASLSIDAYEENWDGSRPFGKESK